MSEGNADSITVEVGPSVNPLSVFLRPDLRGSKQFFVERDARPLFNLKKIVEENKIIRSDAHDLSLAKNSINTIFAANVFAQSSRPDVNVGDFQEIANEWARVIKDNGDVVILETSTPVNRKMLTEIFSKAGFKKIEDHNKEEIPNIFNTEDFEANAYAKSISGMAEDGSYALVFRKTA